MTLYKYTYYMASNKIDIEKLNVKKSKGKYIMKSNNGADYFYSMGITCVYGLDCKTQLNKLIKDDFYTGTVTLYMFSEKYDPIIFIGYVGKYLDDLYNDLWYKKCDFYGLSLNWMKSDNFLNFPKGENKICV